LTPRAGDVISLAEEEKYISMAGPLHITTLCPKPPHSVGVGSWVCAAGEVKMR
jgi:hypothetical protein